MRSGVGQGGGIDAGFVRAGFEHGVHVLDGADAAADGQGHETLVGGALDDLDHGGAAMRAGGDVEEDHFVGALLVVAEGQFDGVADVAQFAGFGLAELDAAGDFAVMHIQTRNNAFCQHGLVLARGR